MVNVRAPNVSGVQAPEFSRQAGLLENSVGLVHGRSAPERREPIVEPQLRQSPERVQGEHGSWLDTRVCAPASHVLFRPEESHGASREYDVCPPSRGGHGEVHDRVARIARQASVADFHGERVSAIRALGVDTRGCRPPCPGQHCRDTERIPDAVGVDGSIADVHAEIRLGGRERRRHPDVTRGGAEYDGAARRQSVEGSGRVVRIDVECLRHARW